MTLVEPILNPRAAAFARLVTAVSSLSDNVLKPLFSGAYYSALNTLGHGLPSSWSATISPSTTVPSSRPRSGSMMYGNRYSQGHIKRYRGFDGCSLRRGRRNFERSIECHYALAHTVEPDTFAARLIGTHPDTLIRNPQQSSSITHR